MKKYGRSQIVVTDGLCSYPAALKEIGMADRHEVGRRLNNRAENSHQPFRQRERAMQRFRSMKWGSLGSLGRNPKWRPSAILGHALCPSPILSSRWVFGSQPPASIASFEDYP
jgi:DDE domain